MKNNEKVGTIIVLLFFAILAGIWVFQKVLYTRAIKTLTALDPQHITAFGIYRSFTKPIENPTVFQPSDPMVAAFFQSLTDLRAYSPSHDTVWPNQRWFVEIAVGNEIIQIHCYIPSDKGDIVVGNLGSFNGKGWGFHHGYFQSKLLFQWYQKYKDRWLTPPAPPQSPGG